MRQSSVLTGSIKLRAIGLDENKEKKMIVYNCINLQDLHEGGGSYSLLAAANRSCAVRTGNVDKTSSVRFVLHPHSSAQDF